jgi:hypothetical protein
MLIDINAERAKSLVWSMKNYLAQAGYEVPNTVLLEAFSQGIGCTNYRTLKAVSGASKHNAPDRREVARQLMKGDRVAVVRFDMHFLADGGSVESALMYIHAHEMEALLEAWDTVLHDGVESVSVKPPFLAYEGDGPMNLQPSMLKVTRTGIKFSVVMFYRGHHRSAHIETWKFSTLVDDMNMRTPGAVVDAGASQKHEEGEFEEVGSNRLEGITAMAQRMRSIEQVSEFPEGAGQTIELIGEVRKAEIEGVPASTGVAKAMPTRHVNIPLEMQLEWWQNEHLAEALEEGWAVFDTAGVGSSPNLCLQMDDEAGRFEDDLEAWAHILKRADEDMSSAAFRALQLMTPRYEMTIRRDVAEAQRTGNLK